jgi:hypothetical protein
LVKATDKDNRSDNLVGATPPEIKTDKLVALLAIDDNQDMIEALHF